MKRKVTRTTKSDPTKTPKRKMYSTPADKPKSVIEREKREKEEAARKPLPKDYRGGTLRPSKPKSKK